MQSAVASDGDATLMDAPPSSSSQPRIARRAAKKSEKVSDCKIDISARVPVTTRNADGGRKQEWKRGKSL